MTETAQKERGRIRREGMGGFLNPPTHPERTMSVEFDLRRHRENRGRMSLSAAIESEWLDDATRAEAKRQLDEWQAPPIDSPEVQDWVHQVLGYFRTCYRNKDLQEPECWHASKVTISKANDPVDNADDHCGVHLIRKYYPDFKPTVGDFEKAYWGTKPA